MGWFPPAHAPCEQRAIRPFQEKNSPEVLKKRRGGPAPPQKNIPGAFPSAKSWFFLIPWVGPSFYKIDRKRCVESVLVAEGSWYNFLLGVRAQPFFLCPRTPCLQKMAVRHVAYKGAFEKQEPPFFLGIDKMMAPNATSEELFQHNKKALHPTTAFIDSNQGL